MPGNAADQSVTERAADRAEAAGVLRSWVNNAAVFRGSLDASAAQDVVDLITLNLAPAVVGCATAIRRFLAGRGGGGAGAQEAARTEPNCVYFAPSADWGAPTRSPLRSPICSPTTPASSPAPSCLSTAVARHEEPTPKKPDAAIPGPSVDRLQGPMR